jgi:hypothetical protein
VQVFPYRNRELPSRGKALHRVHACELALQAPNPRHSTQGLLGHAAAGAGLEQFVKFPPRMG